VTVVLLVLGAAAILAVVAHGVSTRRAARRVRSIPPLIPPTASPPAARHRRAQGVASAYSRPDPDESPGAGFFG
jgi:hypothetical protein